MIIKEVVNDLVTNIELNLDDIIESIELNDYLDLIMI